MLNIEKTLLIFIEKIQSLKSDEEKKEYLLKILKSYEIQRDRKIEQLTSFTNSINAPSVKLTKKDVAIQKERKIKNKHMRLKKYRNLKTYEKEIRMWREAKASSRKICDFLKALYNIEIGHCSILRFCKENNI